MVDLNSKRQDIYLTAATVFNGLVCLSPSLRQDDKPRTGIQVLVRQPDTKNLVFLSVYEPSEAAKFFAAEKAVRSGLCHDMSSQNSQNPELMQFAGSITVDLSDFGFPDSGILQASVSGLKAEEDVAVAASVLAKILGVPVIQVYRQVANQGGELPDCFNDQEHYLYPLVN